LKTPKTGGIKIKRGYLSETRFQRRRGKDRGIYYAR
jgi:hypothetical protein